MFRHKELNKDKTSVGFFEDSGRVRPLKLRGKKCSAFWMPVKSIEWNTDGLVEGSQIDILDGKPLCEKFVRKEFSCSAGSQKKLIKNNAVPTFKEHFDTDQLERNWDKITFNPVYITAKLHGTSCRCGYLPVIQRPSWFQRLFGIKPAPKYSFVVGSRRVVKSIEGFNSENEDRKKDSFYDEDVWTRISKDHFDNKLLPGETVYFEIVGFLKGTKPIMPGQPTEKLKKFLDKDEYKAWVARYGPSVSFLYGNEVGCCSVFVYRITMSNENGDSIDLSWDQVKNRCDQL
jgi:hypothetical protein